MSQKNVPLLFSFNDGLGIELSTKVDMPLNKERKERISIVVIIFTF